MRAQTLRRLLLASLLACLFSPLSLLASDWERELADIANLPGLEVKSYRVSGENELQLREAMSAHGPTDYQGIPRDALTSWRVNWRWKNTASGKPDFSNIKLETSIKILLPYWENRSAAPKELRLKWQKFVHALALHEKEHVKRFINLLPKLQQVRLEIEAHPERYNAALANDAFSDVLARMREADLRLDVETDNGKLQGSKFP